MFTTFAYVQSEGYNYGNRHALLGYAVYVNWQQQGNDSGRTY
jgi:hypothetical protein